MWGSAATVHLERVFILQKSAVRAIASATWDAHCGPLFEHFSVMSLFAQICYVNVCDVHRNIAKYQTSAQIHDYVTRQNQNLRQPKLRLQRNNCVTLKINLYNALPKEYKDFSNKRFKNTLKHDLTKNCLYSTADFYKIYK